VILRNILIVVLLTGCATLINGPTQKIPVKSEPQDATVTVEESSTSTPATFTLDRNREYVLTITKEGYHTETIKIVQVVNAAVAGNILGCTLLGMAIDTATGACWTLKPEEITVTLRPLSPLEQLADAFRITPDSLENQLASLEELKDAKLLTETQYTIFKDLTLRCVENS